MSATVPIVEIDHVQLAAPPGCETAARAFYGNLLGLAELRKPEPLASRGGIWFAVGAQQLHIGVTSEFAPASKAHPGLRVDDLGALAARLLSAGAPVDWDTTLPDRRRFFTADPWGNRIEFLAEG